MDYVFNSKIDFILTRGSGIKSCLFDVESKQMISNLIPLSIFQDKNFFCFDYITNRKRLAVDGMTCIVIIRPVSLKALIEELSSPSYSKYILLFTSPIDPFTLEILASADIKSLVSEVHELNLDLYKQGPHLYTINSVDQKRITEGLISLVTALEINPHVQVIEDNKAKNENLLELGRDLIKTASEYKFKSEGTLILLNRNYDLITPLIYDWHYQSLIYNHCEVNNSVATIKNKEYPLGDSFFYDNRFKEISTVSNSLQKILKEVEKVQERIITNSFDDLEESIQTKGRVENHLNIYTHIINECVKNKDFSEIQMEVLSSKEIFDVLAIEEKLTKNQVLNIIIIYLLKHQKDWSIIPEMFNKYKERIEEFEKKYTPRKFNYKNEIKSNIDLKLAYVSPLKKLIKHIVLRKLRENTFIGLNNETKTISPLLIFINGGVTINEYREVIECEKEYKIDIILVGTSILTNQTFLSI